MSRFIMRTRGYVPSGASVPEVYPDAVLSMVDAQGNDNMKKIWDLRNPANCGARVPQLSMTPVSGLGLLANSGQVMLRSQTSSPAAQIDANMTLLVTGGSHSYTKTDFTGAGLYVYNDGANLTLTDCYIYNPGGHILKLGSDDGGNTHSGTNNATFNYVTFNYQGVENTDASVMGNASLADTMIFDHCWFNTASRGYWQCACNLSMTWCYMGGFAQQPKYNGTPGTCNVADHDHLEPWKFNGGTLTIQYCLFDPSTEAVGDPCISGYTAANGFVTSGVSGTTITASGGVLTVPAGGADIHATIDNCILYGAQYIAKNCSGGLLYTMQGKASLGYNTYLTISNSLIEKASIGYLTIAQQGYLATTSHSGNFQAPTPGVNGEFVTGQTSGATAQVQGWDPTTGLLTLIPSTQLASNHSQWDGAFQPNETVKGSITGVTAQIGPTSAAILQNVVSIIDGGGNRDWDTGRPVNAQTGVLG